MNWREGKRNRNKATNVFLIIILLKTVFFRPHEKKRKKEKSKVGGKRKPVERERETFSPFDVLSIEVRGGVNTFITQKTFSLS